MSELNWIVGHSTYVRKLLVDWWIHVGNWVTRTFTVEFSVFGFSRLVHRNDLFLKTTNKQTKIRSDWWAASPVSRRLFCVPLAPQEDLVVKRREAWAEKQPMRTPKVSSPGFIWDNGVASLLCFHSAKYSYSNLTYMLSLMYAVSWLVKYSG